MAAKIKIILPFLVFAVVICAAVGKIYSGSAYDISATIKEVTVSDSGDVTLLVDGVYYNYGGGESELTLVVPQELAEGRRGLITGFGIVCNYKTDNGENVVTKIY